MKSNFLIFKYIILLTYIHSLLAIEETATEIEIPYTIKSKNIFELNSYYIITRINYKFNTQNIHNYLFGIFLGSNSTNNSNLMPIGIIKSPNDSLIITTTAIPYKYIHYIPPNNNDISITSLKIFGHNNYINSSSLNNTYNYFQVTNLPLILINTENQKEPIFKEEYIQSKIILINKGQISLNDTAQIKVRGHSTSVTVKKPFKIKFDKKQKILDIEGAFKKWTLLANYYDKSLLRNILAFKLGEIFKLNFTPRCIPVDLILNNNFRGNYLICDQIEVNEDRINIEKMSFFDIEEPNITGGYLLEFDFKILEEDDTIDNEKSFIFTEKGLVGEIKHPDSKEINNKQNDYIIKFLNIIENNVYNGDISNIDLDSFSKYFLLEEFCGNIDFVLSSFYCYKKRNINKLYFGPIWDFDLSFDNDERLIPTNDKNDFCLNYGDSAGNLRYFIKNLLKNKNVMENINKTWIQIKENGFDLNIIINFIEEKKNLIIESGELNNLKWYNSIYGKEKEEYLKNVDIVVSYIEKRLDKLTFLINNYNYSDKRLVFNFCFVILIFMFLFL